MKKIAFIPIDNRPVCCELPKLIASIDQDIEFYIPDRKLLGDLTKSADIPGLFEWLMKLPKMDSIILSLDTIAYGGLIPSRRCDTPFETIKARVNSLKEILEDKEAKIYAVSSVMRISNNNYNEEEKEYWSQWGKEIFKYSFNTHKYGSCETKVPPDILRDYIETRRRNFEINKIYLNWEKSGLFETLVFSKDDCAEYGFNVQEAELLSQMGGYVKTGADEIPIALLAKSIQDNVKICPIFTEPDYKDLISNYEDISIEQSVYSQIQLAGCQVSSEKDADILLYVNNFKNNQGEIVMKVNTEPFSGTFTTPKKPYMIGDVRYANGSDNNFVRELFKNNLDDENFYGYSAWNTSANTLGSLICAGKIKFLAQKYNKQNFKNLQAIRFLDDWAYQANVRQQLNSPDINLVKEKLNSYEEKVSKILNTQICAKYTFPWNRLFEIEITL